MGWRTIIAAKILLARLPISYRFWKRMGIFVAGRMDQSEYALGVFKKHFQRANARTALGTGFVALELGPGDSVASAILARAQGASRIYLVDAAPLATRDIDFYRRVARKFRDKGIELVDLSPYGNFSQFLAGLNAHYLTSGLESLKSIPSGSVDYIFSHTVLQHVRLRELDVTLQELRRILAPGGVVSLRIDLSDMLEHSLNHLRFSERFWEMDWIACSGFYTNRLRFDALCARFRRASFDVEILHIDKWESLPIRRDLFAAPFRALSEEELRISGFDVVLLPASVGQA